MPQSEPEVTDALVDEVIAKASHPLLPSGPWRYCGTNADRGGCSCGLIWNGAGTEPVAQALNRSEERCRIPQAEQTAVAEHIERMDPPTAKALALEVRRLRAELDDMSMRVTPSEGEGRHTNPTARTAEYAAQLVYDLRDQVPASNETLWKHLDTLGGGLSRLGLAIERGGAPTGLPNEALDE